MVLSLIALVLAYLGVALLRRWAEQCRLLDIPNERSSHTRPMPRGGGLAIVVVSLGGLLVSWFFNLHWSWLVLLSYITGAGLISLVSWLDDLHSLPNCVRFTVHSLGAVLVILGFGYWHTVTLPGLGNHPFRTSGGPEEVQRAPLLERASARADRRRSFRCHRHAARYVGVGGVPPSIRLGSRRRVDLLVETDRDPLQRRLILLRMVRGSEGPKKGRARSVKSPKC